VLPSFWNDNYVSLLPGETRELTVRFAASALGGARPLVVMTGWNVVKTTTDIQLQSKVRNGETRCAGDCAG
jgi:hypothetical protein